MVLNIITLVARIIESLICFYIYDQTIELKGNVKKGAIAFIVLGYLFTGTAVILFSESVNEICVFLVNFVLSYLIIKLSFSKSLLVSLVVCVISFFINITREYMLTGRVNENEPLKYLLVIIINLSISFVIIKILTIVINKAVNHKDDKYSSIALSVLALLLLIMVFSVTRNFNIVILIALLIALFIIAVLSFYKENLRKKKELSELKLIQQEQRLNETYFELLNHQNEELQLFVHDTKKHYMNIYDLSGDDATIKEYIENLVSDIDRTNRIGKTSNKLLDIIISKYDYICKKENILFEKNIHSSNLGFFENADLTSILNNLFDNAVEAAKTSERKYIKFSLNQINKMLVLEISNSCDNPPISENKQLISSKKGLHGYGFKSVLRSVKKYKGDADWEYLPDQKLFVVSIIFST